MSFNNKTRAGFIGSGLVLAALVAGAFTTAGASAAPAQQATGTTTAMATTTMGMPMATTTMGMGTPMATTTMGMGTPMATTTMGMPMATGTAMMGTPMATGTSMAGMATPSITPSTPITPGIETAERFGTYYKSHGGIDLVGYPVSYELTITGPNNSLVPAQYFQKGRLEDQRDNGYTGDWAYTYGLLVPDLIAKGSNTAVSDTSLTWAMLKTTAGQNMVQPPTGFVSGAYLYPDGRNTFIPYSTDLSPAAGYNVPSYFWDYMNNPTYFPAGWLHDLGLPLTADMAATVVKGSETRDIHVQAFERGVLTYDPKNDVQYFVERANVGYDYLVEFNVNPGTMPMATTTPMASTTSMPMTTTTPMATTTMGMSTPMATTTMGMGTTTPVATTTMGMGSATPATTNTAGVIGTSTPGSATPATTNTAGVIGTSTPGATTTP
jgi:hypothetical protein